MTILIKNGQLFQNGTFTKGDILFDQNMILKIASSINEDADEIIDAAGKHIMPGFIDLHSHLRDPGQTYKEDLLSGCKAAAKGGYTTICAMPNTEPVVDNIAAVDYVHHKSELIGLCHVEVVGCLSKKQEGKEIAEIASMKDGGIVAVSDDGNCIQNAKLMNNIMKYALNYDTPIIIHAEDYNLAGKGQINAGKVASRLGLGGIPGLAEEIIIARDIMLARSTKCRLHIAHVSTARSLELIRSAKEEGLDVTCEVTPHHLLFTEDNCLTFDTNFKVKPPLRTENDRQACIAGLKSGLIDMIATDHAPHADFEKEKEFDLAPFGINGFETSFASLYTELVLKGIISLELLISKLTLEPAKWLRINRGELAVGKEPDLVIADLNDEVEFTSDTMLSRSKNTPYLGKKLCGKITKTFCKGKVSWEA